MSAVHTVKHSRPVVVLEDESANSESFGSTPLPIPPGPPLCDSFAPSPPSKHPQIVAGEVDARAILRGIL